VADPAFAPFLVRALAQVRYRDEPIAFDAYGEYAACTGGTTAVAELLATLAWMGAAARGVLPELDSLRAGPTALPRTVQRELARAIDAIHAGDAGAPGSDCCALPGSLGRWTRPRDARARADALAAVTFEDHDGRSIGFPEFFTGQPTVVAFFYTRCDNPLKCSLTIAKLARVQTLLDADGLAGVRTAAITYDPAFDRPERLRVYGADRAMRLNEAHRMLRTVHGADALRDHFAPGVNFVESLVNRHRVELYVLDGAGRIAAGFERLLWDERQVVDCVAKVLGEDRSASGTRAGRRGGLARPLQRVTVSGAASLGVAFFPKCPVCWGAYMSALGIAGLGPIPYAPWLQPVLAAIVAVNLASIALRARATGSWLPLGLAAAGASLITLSLFESAPPAVAIAGVVLTAAGSLLSALTLTWSRGRVGASAPTSSRA
jgi:protein SCO1/2